MFKITETKQKTSEILTKCKKLFSVWSYYSNEQLDKDFPIPKKTTRYFKKVVEADEELKGISVNELKEKRIEGITLRERLLMELQYFKETNKHLDINNITLCSGSRFADGSVPCVRWGGDELRVGWSHPDDQGDRLRSRALELLN